MWPENERIVHIANPYFGISAVVYIAMSLYSNMHMFALYMCYYTRGEPEQAPNARESRTAWHIIPQYDLIERMYVTLWNAIFYGRPLPISATT